MPKVQCHEINNHIEELAESVRFLRLNAKLSDTIRYEMLRILTCAGKPTSVSLMYTARNRQLKSVKTEKKLKSRKQTCSEVNNSKQLWESTVGRINMNFVEGWQVST